MDDFGVLDYNGDTVTYAYKGKTYSLSSNEYGPCLFLHENDVCVCTLQNAYTVRRLREAFSAGETLRTIYAKEYIKEFDEAAFCRALAAALDSGRAEIDLFDAAKLAGLKQPGS